MWQIVLFIVVSLAFVVGTHWYLVTRFVRGTPMPATWRKRATAVIVTLAVITPVGMSAQFWAPGWLAAPTAFIAYAWQGAVFLFLVTAVPLEAAYWAGKLRPGGTDELDDPGRRRFLSATAATVVYATVGGTSLVSIWQGLRRPEVRRVEVRIPGLDAAFDGFRIAQITDIHVGPTIGRDFVDDVVARVNALEPDLVAMTGDLVDGSVPMLEVDVAPMADLRAPHGVFFVTGNHEYYSGAAEWVDHAKNGLGMRVLENEHVRIERDGAFFQLAGVYDWEAGDHRDGHVSDVSAATAGTDPDAPTVLLAHQPKSIEAAADAGVALQISGHTHGGQIWPFGALVKLDQTYVHGLYQHNERTQIYVSAGTGYWGPPMRLATRAEITEIVLRTG